MKKIYRRVLAMGLSLVLAVTSVPTAAFAVEHVEAEDAVVLPEESEHIETAPEQAEVGDASSTGDVTVEGIETTGSSDQTAAGETAGEAQSDAGRDGCAGSRAGLHLLRAGRYDPFCHQPDDGMHGAVRGKRGGRQHLLKWRGIRGDL